MTSIQEAVRQDREGRPRVLCVDDEPHVLESLRNTLRRQFDVRTAVSGADGLRCLSEQGPFTVVMSDFVMPGMNGAEFLTQARMTAPETVRILLTGHATLGNTLAAVNAGNIFRLLLKPCAPADLILALDDGIEQARLLTADRALLQRQLDAMCGHVVRAERLASLGTMAGAVGHELNNLLMVFGGAARRSKRPWRREWRPARRASPLSARSRSTSRCTPGIY
jgi:DNA-binding NtrC family response regulator